MASSGDVLEQLQPERALPGDDLGVVERVHEHGAGLLRALAGARDAGVDRLAAEPHVPPKPRTAAALETDASAGMNTSHAIPRARAA